VLLDLDAIFHPELDRPPDQRDIGPDDLPPEWRYAWEERAAIMEYDGGQPKEHAEAAALADTLERMRAAGGRLESECRCPACQRRGRGRY
jgi:hypothetical protein